MIFDLLNDNCLEMINPESSFQYYYLRNLSEDIERAESAGLSLINLFTEPLKTQMIADRFFPGKVIGQQASPKASYDMHTKYAGLRNLHGNYLYTADEVLAQMEQFIKAYKR